MTLPSSAQKISRQAARESCSRGALMNGVQVQEVVPPSEMESEDEASLAVEAGPSGAPFGLRLISTDSDCLVDTPAVEACAIYAKQ